MKMVPTRRHESTSELNLSAERKGEITEGDQHRLGPYNTEVDLFSLLQISPFGNEQYFPFPHICAPLSFEWSCSLDCKQRCQRPIFLEDTC